ncbi:MAG: potassium transporter TrkG, partial [Bacillota bacterium]|nr:potassium transporter TrkG [Bacillota bacterium]
LKPTGDVRYREGFTLVALAWLLAALFGALPYFFAGTFPTFADAFFESMSGFTTTGASVMTEIEGNPQAILLWRSITHWLGGLGIIVLFVAVLSQLGIGAMKIFRAEVPGPTTEKIKPRITETAKIFLSIYLVLTFAQIAILMILGMSLFDALVHTFGTVATGGFSSKNDSIASFSPAIQWVITLFMFLAGANFALYYLLVLQKSPAVFWKNEEFRFYSFITIIVSIIIATVLWTNGSFPNLEEALRTAFFQVVSIITTTGFATANYDIWPIALQGLIISLMFVGGCVGSTGGGLKVGRHLIMLKQTWLELNRAIHPRAFFSIKVNGKSVQPEVLSSIFQFFYLYAFLFIVGSIYMSALGFDLITSFSSVAASIGNIGPGLGRVGPVENFAFLPAHAKFVHSFLMLLGRLEIYTILVLLLPNFWRKG